MKIRKSRGRMEKRAFERIPEKIRVDLNYRNDRHEGTVMDLSYNGLFIDAGVHPSSGSALEVVLILGDEVFMLPGKVKRLVNTNSSSCGIGVELSEPSESYCAFVSTMIDYKRKME